MQKQEGDHPGGAQQKDHRQAINSSGPYLLCG